MAAPEGNNNSGKGKIIRSVIKKRLEERKAIEQIVDKMIDQAIEGDAKARADVFERVDGKVAQAIIGDHDEDSIKIDTKHTVEFIYPEDKK